jgi:Flp pilus assembly protein TadG
MNSPTHLNTVEAMTLPAVRCLKSRHSRAGKRRGQGQVTVEFALICIPFFAILFAIIDYAQIYFYSNSLQNAMREAARFATAGRVIEKTYADGSIVYETNAGVVMPAAITDANGSREASRNECIRYWFLSNCEFQIPLSSITISNASTLSGVPPTTTTNSFGDLVLLSSDGSPAVKGPGAANNYIQITASMTVTTITPLMSYLGGYSHQGYFQYPVKVSAIVKNEPALLNFLHTNMYSDEP